MIDVLFHSATQVSGSEKRHMCGQGLILRHIKKVSLNVIAYYSPGKSLHVLATSANLDNMVNFHKGKIMHLTPLSCSEGGRGGGGWGETKAIYS